MSYREPDVTLSGGRLIQRELRGLCYLCDTEVSKPGEQYCKGHKESGSYYPYLPINDVAHVLAIHSSTLVTYVNTGKIQGKKIKGKWFIHVDSLDSEEEEA